MPRHFDRPERPCSNPEFDAVVSAYCFCEMPDAERWRFEAHLLECDACWAEVQRMDEVVRVLRSDRALSRSVFSSSIIGTIGISARLRRTFGGHGLYMVTVAVVWALLFAISVPMELSYQYDRLGSQTGMAVEIFVWMTVGCLLALFLAIRTAQGKQRSGPSAILAIPIVFAVIMYALVRPHLPDWGITTSPTLHAATAQSAFLKTLVYFLPFASVFVFLPFHAAISLQREVLNGRHRTVLGILTGSRDVIAPKGVLFLPMRVLIGAFAVATGISFYMLMHLIDNLAPDPNTNRFTIYVELRWTLCFMLGVVALGWYYRVITELKRECLAVRALFAAENAK